MSYTDLFWVVNGFLLTLIGLLLVVLLVKVTLFLNLVSNFANTAQFELMRIIQDLRQTTDRVDTVSEKTAHRLESILPLIDNTVEGVRNAPKYVKAGVQSVFQGIRHAFMR